MKNEHLSWNSLTNDKSCVVNGLITKYKCKNVGYLNFAGKFCQKLSVLSGQMYS